jgi:hypothetical protein
MQNRRLTRLTNAHSKSLDHHTAMMGLFTAWLQLLPHVFDAEAGQGQADSCDGCGADGSRVDDSGIAGCGDLIAIAI